MQILKAWQPFYSRDAHAVERVHLLNEILHLCRGVESHDDALIDHVLAEAVEGLQVVLHNGATGHREQGLRQVQGQRAEPVGILKSY